jgi:hypothetical protein
MIQVPLTLVELWAKRKPFPEANNRMRINAIFFMLMDLSNGLI